MRVLHKQDGLVISCLVVLLLAVKDADAYLDAGTGSLILQMVVGAVLFVLFTLKVYWAKLKIIMRNMVWKQKTNNGG